MPRRSILALALLIAAPAAAQETKPSLPEGMVLSENPVPYVSAGGEFQVLFPGGCGELVTRINEPDLFAGETIDDIVQIQNVYCDRHQAKGEGCSVTGIYNWHDEEGNPPGPEQVVWRVSRALGKFNARIQSQEPIQRIYNEFTRVEGVDVRARAPEGPGELRVIGVLSGGDIFLLAAWNDAGGLYEDPQMMQFFDSFQPYADPE